MYKRIIRNVILGSFLGLAVAMAVLFLQKISISAKSETDIREEIVRFHIRANSNDVDDIKIKYKVRNVCIDELSKELDEKGLEVGNMSKDDYLAFLADVIPKIERKSKEILKAEGCNFDVKAYVVNDYFPIRQYGEIIVPAGYYDALRVDIGKARGENFWCVLYPDVCYPIDGAAVITKEGEKEISRKISDEEYEKLFINHEKKAKVKFKLFEWIESIF